MATPSPITEMEGTLPQHQQRRKNRAIVKSVLSGDSIVVQSDTNPPQEKVITLSSLSAPRLSRGEKDQAVPTDEAWAWEAREFVRKAVVGKRITFVVEYTHPASKREYCTVYYPGPQGDVNLNELVVAEGWAKVLSSKKEGKEVFQALEEGAQQAGKGMHLKDAKPTPRPSDVEADSIYGKLKGKTLDAVVEQVRTGSSVRVTILPTRHQFQILLSGVQSPGWRKKDGDTTGEPQPEQFAREAKLFVEQHVLQRDVKLTIEGIAPGGAGSDKNGGAFSGSIEYNGHDVAEELLKAGFARYIAYSAAPRGQASVLKLKAAERFAKEKKLRLYANYVEPKPDAAIGNTSLPKEFSGKVISILNSGAILVLPDHSSHEVQINLSSIRLPRPGFPGDEEQDAKEPNKKKVEEDRAERAWAGEGKELLRKRLIGQKVRIVYDYTRQATAGKKEGDKPLPEKAYYSVYQGETNLAVVLVESGLAWVMAGGRGEERSMDFEVLILAEQKAKTAKKGLHMPLEKVPPRRMNDLCVDADEPKQRAKQIERTRPHLPSLQRTGPHKAIVDYVFSGARYKVTIPKLSMILIMTLGGLRVPKRDENEELSNQALLFARELLHQREVSLEIDDLDKGGNFIGSITTPSKKNISVLLLESGFAAVHGPSADRMKDGRELYEAEKVAKSKRLRMWKDYDEEEEKRKAEAAAAAEAEENATHASSSSSYSSSFPSSSSSSSSRSSFEVFVTEVIDGASFYAQISGQETAGLEELVNSLTALSTEEGGGIPVPNANVGELVRGQFSMDDRWYRAKVLENKNKGNDYKLLYIDYGNVEVVAGPRVRMLPAKYHALPAQAQLATLAFIKPLKEDNDFAKDARVYLQKAVDGMKLKGSVEYRDRDTNKLYLTLSTPDGKYNIAQEMVREGLARVDRSKFASRRHGGNPQYVKLLEEESQAKSRHVRIWYQGDVPDSDEDEGPSIRPPRSSGQGKGKPQDAAGKEAPKKK